MQGNGNVEYGRTEKLPILITKRRECCLVCPKRWLFTLLGFLGLLNVYAMRVNLSVAMVAMVRKDDRDNNTFTSVACFELLKQAPNNTSSYSDSDGDFDWDASTQAMILGSFFYGYVITQIPGGYFAEKYGAKWFFGIGVLITSVFTLVTPYAAFWGIWPLIVVRVIEGLGEGVTFPAMSVMIGRWAPKNERSRISAIISNGASMGNVVSFALSGYISDTLGWPYVFYIFGVVGIIWTVLWLLLVYDAPDLHPCITEEEIEHIRRGQDSSSEWKSPTVPWKDILTSSFLWALVITQFGQSWGYYTLLTEMPTYLAQILHFDITKNGVLSALPYLMVTIIAIVISCVADKLRASGQYKINTIRKFFNTIGFLSPALCIAAVAYVGCQPTVIIVLLVAAVGLNGVAHSGYSITHVDMSPEFAGTVMGISNGIGNLTGFLAPAYVGFITQHGQTVANWKIIFLTSAAVYVVAGLVYIFFATAEQQPWGSSRKIGKTSVNEHDDNVRTTFKHHLR